MKLFQVTIPASREQETLSVLDANPSIKGFVALQAATGDATLVFQFRVTDKECPRIMSKLQKIGVGVRFGFCDIMQLHSGTAVEALNTHTTETMLLTPTEIYRSISQKVVLNKNNQVLLAISAVIAGIGLATDSQVYVVASMLMSPILGPIVGASFGLAIIDRQLFVISVKNTLRMLVITFLWGCFQGIIFCPFAERFLWPTGQMVTRGITAELMFGALVAIGGGAAVALAESNSNVPSIVGIGIAASVLPPSVLCGLCLTAAYLGPYIVPDISFPRDVYLEIVSNSAALVVVNVFLIYATAYVVFKMITPLQQFRFESAGNKHMEFLPFSMGWFLKNKEIRSPYVSPRAPPRSSLGRQDPELNKGRERFESM